MPIPFALIPVTYRCRPLVDGRRELYLAVPQETWQHLAAAAIVHGDDGCHDVAVLLRTKATGTKRLATHERPVDAVAYTPCRTMTYRIGHHVDGRIEMTLQLESETWVHLVAALRAHGDAGCAELAELLDRGHTARLHGSRPLPVHDVPFAGDYIEGTGDDDEECVGASQLDWR
jgi:hypothetical protein